MKSGLAGGLETAGLAGTGPSEAVSFTTEDMRDLFSFRCEFRFKGVLENKNARNE